MQRNQKKVSAGGMIILLLVFLNTVILEEGLTSGQNWYKLTFFTIPLLLIAIVVYRHKTLK